MEISEAIKGIKGKQGMETFHRFLQATVDKRVRKNNRKKMVRNWLWRTWSRASLSSASDMVAEGNIKSGYTELGILKGTLEGSLDQIQLTGIIVPTPTSATMDLAFHGKAWSLGRRANLVRKGDFPHRLRTCWTISNTDAFGNKSEFLLPF